MKSLRNRLDEQSRFCKAALIQRVPRTVCKILKILILNNLLGRNILIIGTNAMYAYEAASGVFLESPMLATQDMDLLWDIRPKLTLYTDHKIDQTGLINLLRKADRSFEPITPRSYRAVGQILMQYLPQFKFDNNHLKMFPKEIANAGKKWIQNGSSQV